MNWGRLLVKRNDALTLADIDALKPQKIVISPGPCTPDEPGSPLTLFATMPGACRFLASASVIRQWRRHLAVKLCAPQRSCTAKPRRLHITVRRIWGLANPLTVTRYHSLVVEPDSLPACFDVTAWSETREIMGIRHRQWDLEGVQFHPESILSEQGHQLLANFLHR
ncbi:glutamine amidotransferase-related protein [Escherichia coli]